MTTVKFYVSSIHKRHCLGEAEDAWTTVYTTDRDKQCAIMNTWGSSSILISEPYDGNGNSNHDDDDALDVESRIV